MTFNLPKVNMESIQKIDIQQEYYLLFKHMMKDFLTISDFKKMIMTMVVNHPLGPGTLMLTDPSTPFAEIQNTIYIGLAKTGGAVKAQAIKGAEAITADK